MFYNIFYRFYYFFKYTEDQLTPKSLRMPEYIAGFFISLLMILNLIALDILFKTIFNYHLVLISKSIAIVYVIGIYICLYFVIYYKKRYLRIIEKYRSETKRDKILGVILAITYIIFTIMFLIIVVYYRKQ